eukprot:5217273-Pyramimonas_sp.AAC.2
MSASTFRRLNMFARFDHAAVLTGKSPPHGRQKTTGADFGSQSAARMASRSQSAAGAAAGNPEDLLHAFAAAKAKPVVHVNRRIDVARDQTHYLTPCHRIATPSLVASTEDPSQSPGQPVDPRWTPYESPMDPLCPSRVPS